MHLISARRTTAQAYYSSDLSQAILHNHSFKSSSSPPTHYAIFPSQLSGRNYGAHGKTAVNSMHLVYSIKVRTAKKYIFLGKKWRLERSKINHTTLLEEFRLCPADFTIFLRMLEENYLELLSILDPVRKKQDTVLSQSISSHEPLTATLRILAT